MFLIIIASCNSFYKYSNLVDFLLYLFEIFLFLKKKNILYIKKKPRMTRIVALNRSPKQQKNGNELTENKNIGDVGTEFLMD